MHIRDGDIHIHDLNMLTGCNAGWSLKELIQQGLGGVAKQTSSAPAKHLITICNQIVNFFGIMQMNGQERNPSHPLIHT